MAVQYTTAAAIAAYLGETFTPAQAAQADALAAAVTAYIDRYCGQTWQTVSPIAAELNPIIARHDDGAATTVPTVYLQHRPAVAVSAVSTRSGAAQAPETVLTPDQYELADPSYGILRLQTFGAGAVDAYGVVLAVVDYTYADAIPPDITLAATMMASATMAGILAAQEGASLIAAHPELAGLKSVSVGQNDVNVQLTDTTKAADATASQSSWVTPGSATAAILNSYRRVVIA